MNNSEDYVLATGKEAAHRLGVVNEVHGQDTRDILLRAGLKPGMRVADFGCGVGIVSLWMASIVGTAGEVVGIDASQGQAEESGRLAEASGSSNVKFQQGDAAQSGLAEDSFDLVFSRFVLMHMPVPHLGIREMIRVLKPGGVLVVEDGDFSSPFTFPDSPAYRRCFDLYRSAVRLTGADPLIGRSLYQMVRDEGLKNVQVKLVQPVVTRGEAKRLPEWTIEECASLLIEKKLTSPEELATLAKHLDQLAMDESMMVGMARVSQVWGVK